MQNKKFALKKLTSLLVISMTLAILSAVLFLLFLVGNNKNYGLIINTSGKQRYLSQKITKTSILIVDGLDSLNVKTHQRNLQSDLELFKSNNDVLLANNNSESVSKDLDALQVDFNKMYSNGTTVLSNSECTSCLQELLEVEPEFLEKMDAIVLKYQQESSASINTFMYVILGSNAILLILLWTFSLKFMNPAIQEIKNKTRLISAQNINLKKLNADQETIISILAKDLKVPLSEMVSLSEQFTKNYDKYSKEVMIGQLRNVNLTTKRAYKLLDNVLLWSALHNKHMEPNPENFKFLEVTNEVISDMENQAKKKNINIRVFEEKPVSLNLDKKMYKAVIQNLISNAIKYSHSGGKVNIYAEESVSDVVVTVADTGVGIEKENIPKIWKITNNYTEVGTNNETGTGFGLKLSKDFVEKHGGEIWVESEPGKGSDFKFRVPQT